MKSILVTATMAHFSLFGVQLWYKPVQRTVIGKRDMVSPAFTSARLQKMRTFPVMHFNCECWLKEMEEGKCVLLFTSVKAQ